MSQKPAIRLYDFPASGHAHRAVLMLSLLKLPFEKIFVDLMAGEQRRTTFLALNPFGTVPVLDDGGTIIADSVAILVYLALRYDPARTWLPQDPATAGEVQRWLSVAQGPMFNGPCSARLVSVFGAKLDHDRAIAASHSLFRVMDAHLTGRRVLVGADPTIAAYSYVAHAPEGGVGLADYPAIRAWLARIEALPGFVAMPASKLPDDS
jgi:glutathione S-transferase